VPNGIPGVAARLPILFSEGVRKGAFRFRSSLALTATNHAKMYGLYPRKGSIMIGADADIAIWDPDKTVTLFQGPHAARQRLHALRRHGSDGMADQDAAGRAGRPTMARSSASREWVSVQARQTTQSPGSA